MTCTTQKDISPFRPQKKPTAKNDILTALKAQKKPKYKKLFTVVKNDKCQNVKKRAKFARYPETGLNTSRQQAEAIPTQYARVYSDPACTYTRV